MSAPEGPTDEPNLNSNEPQLLTAVPAGLVKCTRTITPPRVPSKRVPQDSPAAPTALNTNTPIHRNMDPNLHTAELLNVFVNRIEDGIDRLDNTLPDWLQTLVPEPLTCPICRATVEPIAPSNPDQLE
ncbi:hypothetical protein H4Q26_013414 [Puccinia striiformis f. sp. tritici PST-130]|nr:hypothetical protein H4Q26_013414 [Puccinia striiformis f. sp. tritici PST-130]